MCLLSVEARRRHWSPWNWSYELLCGYWELNWVLCESIKYSEPPSQASATWLMHFDCTKNMVLEGVYEYLFQNIC